MPTALRHYVNKKRKENLEKRKKIDKTKLNTIMSWMKVPESASIKTFNNGYWVAISAYYNTQYGTIFTSTDFREFHSNNILAKKGTNSSSSSSKESTTKSMETGTHL